MENEMIRDENGEIILTDDLCEIVGTKGLDAEKIDKPSLTFWQDVWRRFRENKLALTGLFILAFVIAMVWIGPLISKYDFKEMNYEVKKQGPSLEHWFGTDAEGRDIFTRVCVGGKISIIIGLSCTAVSFIVGSIVGGIAGFTGGKLDNIIMRIIEIIGSIPYLVLVIILSQLFNGSIVSLVFAMTLTSWIGTARVVRGQIMQIKNMDYVSAARALGGDTKRIILKHLLPNTLGVIMVNITLSVPGFIFAESFLSYIGLGVKPPDTSWGALCNTYQQHLMFQPYMLFFPAILIVLTVLSFHLVGDGLTDALDPKQRR